MIVSQRKRFCIDFKKVTRAFNLTAVRGINSTPENDVNL